MAWITMMLGRASGATVGPFTHQSSNGVSGGRYSFTAKTPAAGGFKAFWVRATRVAR